MVLENKLIPDQAGYIGEKFNHFLPNALFVDSAIEFFVSHPTLLWWKLLLFTLFEGVVGLALILGLVTRVAGIATSLLAMGILFGAGWLGTTCLDEWQIGILGVAGGLLIASAGGGRFSLDHQLTGRLPRLMNHPLVALATGLSPSARHSSILAVGGAVFTFSITLFTNQVFHGGVWGKLHNLSVKPRVELSNLAVKGDALSVQFYRVEGADVYGSFAIGLKVLDSAGNVVASWDGRHFSTLAAEDIHNHYVARVQPGAHSLVLPLGARGDVTLRSESLKRLSPGHYTVELVDISGLSWTAPLVIGSSQP